jgi:DNA polymerase (family 10)
MGAKTKYPRSQALFAAREICQALDSACERLVVAGSLRRRKDQVGDIELLFIPKVAKVTTDLFGGTENRPMTDAVLQTLLDKRIITKRPNKNGHFAWGDLNKLALHFATSIPVDFFTASAENWWNYLVCRTGSAENNERIARAAQAKRWKWNPYGAGFTDEHGNLVKVESEQDVFRFVGLPYLEPWQR